MDVTATLGEKNADDNVIAKAYCRSCQKQCHYVIPIFSYSQLNKTLIGN